jgi:hypothetical protein
MDNNRKIPSWMDEYKKEVTDYLNTHPQISAKDFMDKQIEMIKRRVDAEKYG